MCGYLIVFAIPGVLEVLVGLMGLGSEWDFTYIAMLSISKGVIDVVFGVCAMIPAAAMLMGFYHPLDDPSTSVFRFCKFLLVVCNLLKFLLPLVGLLAFNAGCNLPNADECPPELLTLARWWFYRIPLGIFKSIVAIMCALVVLGLAVSIVRVLKTRRSWWVPQQLECKF